MPDEIKKSAMWSLLVAMIASWFFGVDPALQKTFLGLFLTSVAWTPVGSGLRAVVRAMKSS